MPVSVFAASREYGSAVDLFEFIYGEGDFDYFGMTNSERLVQANGKTFYPSPLTYDGYKTRGRDSGIELQVEVSAESEIAQLFRGGVPRRVIYLKHYTGDIPSDEAPEEWEADPATIRLVWIGRIIESNRKGAKVILSCNTLGAGMKRPGLNRFYQRECPHRLYGPYCMADKTAATTQVAISAYDNFSVTLPFGWEGTNERQDYVGGIVEWAGPYGTEYRRIVDLSGDLLMLDSLVTNISNGQTVDVILGCPRTFSACQQLHNNTVNFGGQPYIPRSNPVNKNNHI